MNYDFRYHHRRSIRLPEYDYSESGIYFVTICAYQKQCLFGDIQNGKMSLNQIGMIAEEEWLKSFSIRQGIELDKWIIMPNHLHGIVVFRGKEVHTKDEGTNITLIRKNGLRQRKGSSLSSFIGGFKSSVTKRIKEICHQPNPPVWQRNYYESIVRDEQQLKNIQYYVINNPQQWNDDPENTKSKSQELLIDFPF